MDRRAFLLGAPATALWPVEVARRPTLALATTRGQVLASPRVARAAHDACAI